MTNPGSGQTVPGWQFRGSVQFLVWTARFAGHAKKFRFTEYAIVNGSSIKVRSGSAVTLLRLRMGPMLLITAPSAYCAVFWVTPRVWTLGTWITCLLPCGHSNVTGCS